MIFDTTILTGYRVGTDSICKYISKHPNLYCPGYYGTSFCVDKYNDKKYIDYLKCTHNVFIWHDHNVSSLFNGKRSIRYDRLLHPVRHPYDQAKACYNASLQQSIIKNLSHPSIESYMMSNIGTFDFNHSLKYSRYYDSFDDVKVVEFSRLSKTFFMETMNDVFSWIGVEQIQTKFEFNNDYRDIDFFIENIPLVIKEGVGGIVLFLVDKNKTMPQGVYLLGEVIGCKLGDLHVYITVEEMYSKRRAISIIGVENIKNIIESKIDEWSLFVLLKFDIYKKNKLHHLPDSIIENLNILCRNDYQNVIKKYPEIEGLWGDKWR